MFNKERFFSKAEATLSVLYKGRDMASVKARYENAIDEYQRLYGECDSLSFFSVAGRSEICGNHTDHNHGKVLAASIDLDIIAVAAPTSGTTVRVKSAGFVEDVADITVLDPVKSEKGRSAGLIRGVCDGFTKRGRRIGGFNAYTTSQIMGGSGLSSSAAFEDMIGTILNHFYNDGVMDYMEISQISQYAENAHFGKPCGLMDQVACAAGGFVYIDFEDPKAPRASRVEFDLAKEGYALCIVNTGGSHANLTDDYAAVPAEMKAVAAHFGKSTLREITKADVLRDAAVLRSETGDRAILRALHFMQENERVTALMEALQGGNMKEFLAIIRASGLSSATLLQNYSTPKAPAEQGITLATAIAAELLEKDGAWRVHGGGFAGTIQAFVPKGEVDSFRCAMETVFGTGSVTELTVRPMGALCVYHG